jgi:hypothetical protein
MSQPAERVLVFDSDGLRLLGKKTTIKPRLMNAGLHASQLINVQAKQFNASGTGKLKNSQ